MIPRPCGHRPHFTYKCLWPQPLTDLQPGNVILSNMIVVGFRWLLFSLYLMVCFWFPTKNIYCLCNLKKRNESTRAIKIMVVKWVRVCQKKLTSSSSFSMWVHATEWVQCPHLTPRDQLSIIANLKANYQQEAEAVDFYLMDDTWESPLVGERRVGSAPEEMRWHI